LVPSNFKDISARRPPPIFSISTISREIVVITKEIAVLTGYLLKGLFISIGRKARAEVIPKTSIAHLRAV